MKKIIFTGLLIVFIAASLAGQVSKTSIAFTLLDDYLNKKKDGGKGAPYVGIVLGCTVMAIGGAGLLWKDQIIDGFEISEPAVIDNWELGSKIVVGSGALISLIGVGALMVPASDSLKDYEYLYDEKDPVVRESLAAGVLYTLSEDAKEKRVNSAIINILTPLVAVGFTIVDNIKENKEWYTGTRDSAVSFSFSFVDGISKLFFHKSKEEKLYDQYLQTKENILQSEK